MNERGPAERGPSRNIRHIGSTETAHEPVDKRDVIFCGGNTRGFFALAALKRLDDGNLRLQPETGVGTSDSIGHYRKRGAFMRKGFSVGNKTVRRIQGDLANKTLITSAVELVEIHNKKTTMRAQFGNEIN